MPLTALASFLREAIGLDPASLGPEVLEGALRRRLRATGLETRSDYLALLRRSAAEGQALIEQVVVPETSFFRDGAPFALLARHAERAWRGASPGAPLRILSVPCATGEEAYSIAMALVEAGLAPEAVEVLAVDVSRTAIQQAERGAYRTRALAGVPAELRDRYFDATARGFRVRQALRGRIRFAAANLVAPMFLGEEAPFDAIFCRNLLIYLHAAARSRALARLDALLAPEGLLFVGHAEAMPAVSARFEAVPEAGAFAYRKARQSLAEDARPPLLPPVRPAPRPGSRPGPALASPPRRPPRASALPPAGPGREALLTQARQLADAGRLAEAAAVCEACLRLDPANPQVHFLLGVILEAAGDAARAETALTRAVYLDAEHYEAILHLGLLRARRGDAAGAEALRQRAARLGAEGTA